MTDDLRKELSKKYCPRFGQLAIQFGFITEAQLIEALACQVRDELHGNGHRLLGEILFQTEVMSAPQIEQVMTELFRCMRQEQDNKKGSQWPHSDITINAGKRTSRGLKVVRT